MRKSSFLLSAPILWWGLVGCTAATFVATSDGGGSSDSSSSSGSGGSGSASSGGAGSGSATSGGAGSGSATTGGAGGGSASGGGGGSADDGGTGGDSAAGACNCSPQEICGFPQAAACSASGKCFPAPAITCAAYGAGCACDGTEINIICTGLPAGYQTKPLQHTGACVDAAPPPADAGGGAACASTVDCPHGEICGFPRADGCNAKGRCFPAPGAVCKAYAAGCACDGTQISTVCNGLPADYETKPLRHAGACVDGG